MQDLLSFPKRGGGIADASVGHYPLLEYSSAKSLLRASWTRSWAALSQAVSCPAFCLQSSLDSHGRRRGSGCKDTQHRIPEGLK